MNDPMANEWTVPGDFATINLAIASAMVQDYDTIRVAPGVYNNASEGAPIIVNKILQLLGAQAGIDARTRPGTPSSESIIEINTVVGSIQVNSNNVVIDGFTVQNNTVGVGILTSQLFSGYWIFNNIIRNNSGGLFFDSNTTSANTTFSQAKNNFFQSNNATGGSGPSGNGIYTQFGTMNLYIDSNRFTGHTPAASINFAAGSEGSTPFPQKNIVISNNEMINDNSIALTNTTNVKITGNRMTNTQGSSILIAGANVLTEIEDNILHDSVTNGINVNTFFNPAPNATIRAKNNSIQGNANAGLTIQSGSYNVTPRRLDATNNWWGSVTGPTNMANPGGTGDTIVDPDSVSEFIPFLFADPIGPSCEELLAASQAALAAAIAELNATRAALAATQTQLLECQSAFAAASQSALSTTQTRTLPTAQTVQVGLAPAKLKKIKKRRCVVLIVKRKLLRRKNKMLCRRKKPLCKRKKALCLRKKRLCKWKKALCKRKKPFCKRKKRVCKRKRFNKGRRLKKSS